MVIQLCAIPSLSTLFRIALFLKIATILFLILLSYIYVLVISNLDVLFVFIQYLMLQMIDYFAVPDLLASPMMI